ncbi:MAG: S8 family serine peptidase [Elusimicrobia bacterium]|nr:S8 family serine peptidase [Elusimicrobiota bacterium]
MKKHFVSGMAALSLALSLNAGREPVNGAAPSEGRVPNEIVVRFKSARSMGLPPRVRRSAVAGLQKVSPGTRAVHSQVGAREVRRVLRAETGVPQKMRRRAARRGQASRVDLSRAESFRDALDRTAVISIDPKEDLGRVLNAYRGLPDVEQADFNRIYSVQWTPNDPSYGQLWGLTKVDASAAWDLSTGTGVVVAVVDTGVDFFHPDLSANMWVNGDEVPGNGVDDDQNGFVDDVRGWDCVAEDNSPSDVYGHGSHVAGTIAAVGHNAVGVVGLSFNARVMPVKGLNDYGSGTSADLAQALIYAADNGAQVINNSWGGQGTDPLIESAVAYAVSAGAVVVAAAGNSNVDAQTFYPARLPGVLAVSAFDAADQKASFSNFGTRIDVAAPGVSILSTYKGGYSSLNGTSMAAPHVSGLAALILAQHPDYTASQVRQVIRQSADDVGPPGPDIDSGVGRINARAAMVAVPASPDATPPLVSVQTPAPGAVLSGPTVLAGTASDNVGVVKVDVLLDGQFLGVAAGLTAWTYLFDPLPYSGNPVLTVRAWDAEGNVGSASVPVSLVDSGRAVYSSLHNAPACFTPGSVCDSGTLLRGRGLIAGGAEPNSPNTLFTSCADGNNGSFHYDESNDRIRIYTVDGSTLAPGSLVRVDATVWAYTATTDILDLYSAADAGTPSWQWVASVPAATNGAQTLSATFVLPQGSTQAVRARFRYGGAASPCGAGVYDDHDDLVFATLNAVSSKPVVSIATPPEGALLSGSSLWSGLAQDNSALAHVTLSVDGRKWKTLAGAGPAAVSSSDRIPAAETEEGHPLVAFSTWSYVFDTTQLDNGLHTFRVDAVDNENNLTSSTRTFSTDNGALMAVFNSGLGAPECSVLGAACASGGRLEGRDTIHGGFPEPNQPNTLSVTPCPDGTTGSYRADESLDWIRVSSVDGTPLAPGKQVRLDARVWAFSPGANFLDLAYAPDISAPAWVPVGTLGVAGSRLQVVSTTFTLTSGGARQAVRGVFRYQGAPSPGGCVAGGYNDHDDLVFAVLRPPLAPAASFSKPGADTLTLSWAPSSAGDPATGFRLDLSTGPFFVPLLPGFNDTDFGSQRATELLSLTPKTTYYARVRAYNSAGVSPHSLAAIGVTWGRPDLVVSRAGVAPYAMQAGASFNINIEFKNIGEGPSEPDLNFQAFLDAQTAPSWGAFTPLLDPGQTFNWTFRGIAPPEGIHSIKILADAVNQQTELDESNNLGFAHFVVDATPPTVTWVEPANNATISGVAPLTVEAGDGLSGIDRIVFVDGNVVLSTVTAAPFTYPWDLAGVSPGTHVVAARAQDRAGNVTVSSVTVQVVGPHFAQVLSVTSVPATIVQRQVLPAQVTVRNTGFNPWSAAGGYQLGSVDPVDNTVWGLSRASLLAGDNVVFGGTKTFSFTLRAPAGVGTYPLAWQMRKDGVPPLYFGEKAWNNSFVVVADTAPPTIPPGPVLKGPSPTTLLLTWGAASDLAGIAAYRLDVSADPFFSVLLPAYNNLSVGTSRSRSISGLAPGTTYWARVRAVDPNGNVSENAVALPLATLLTADATAPVVSISSPAAGQRITGSITVAAVASDNVDVASVAFWVNGVLKIVDTSSPFSYAWNPSTASDGPYVISAVASDYANNRSTATVAVTLAYDRTPPTVPGNPRLVNPTTNRLTFAWDAATDNEAVIGYRIDVSTVSDFSTRLAGYNNLAVGKVLSRSVSGLAAGTAYHARVRAYDKNSLLSDTSATATAFTKSATVSAAAVDFGTDEPLALGRLYCVPHPVPDGAATFHMEVGSADRVSVRVQRLSGETVFESDSAVAVRTTEGKTAFELRWNTDGLSSGAYLWSVEAHKGAEKVRATQKIVVLR